MRRLGQGIMYYKNGDKYEGEWRNDRREGPGTLRYANGDLYIGTWFEDTMEGRGFFRYVDVIRVGLEPNASIAFHTSHPNAAHQVGAIMC